MLVNKKKFYQGTVIEVIPCIHGKNKILRLLVLGIFMFGVFMPIEIGCNISDVPLLCT